MSLNIAIIDHGFANIGSLENTLRFLNFDVCQISNSSDLSSIPDIDGFILPGVGSFGPAMRSLRSKHLDQVIEALLVSGCRGLGICLGMQMLTKGAKKIALMSLVWVCFLVMLSALILRTQKSSCGLV